MELYLHLLRVCMVGNGAEAQGQLFDLTVVAVTVLCHALNTVACVVWNTHGTEFHRLCWAGTTAGFTQNPFALPVMIIIASVSPGFHFIWSVLNSYLLNCLVFQAACDWSVKSKYTSNGQFVGNVKQLWKVLTVVCDTCDYCVCAPCSSCGIQTPSLCIPIIFRWAIPVVYSLKSNKQVSQTQPEYYLLFCL